MSDDQSHDPRLWLAAVDLVADIGGIGVSAAIQVAEESVTHDLPPSTAVLAVACLPRDTLRSDAEPSIRDMLGEHGIEVPESSDDDAVRVLLSALDRADMSIADLFYPLLDHIPDWDHQTDLERRLMVVFGALEVAGRPEEQHAIVDAALAHLRRAPTRP